MTEENNLEIIPRTAEIPPQLLTHFKEVKGMTDEEISKLQHIYQGPKTNPSMQEWLESYQQYTFFQHSANEITRMKKIEQDVEDSKVRLEEAHKTEDDKLIKAAKRDLRARESILSNSQNRWYLLNKELNKILQMQLSRESAKKIDMRSIKVTPGDIAQMMKQGNQQ